MKKDQASTTAYTVLQGQLLSARNPIYKDLISEDTESACMQILKSSEEGRKRIKQLDSKVSSFFAPLAESILMPGITLHYVLRKKFIEDTVVKAITNGVTQVVNLGAGFDTLAWRLHKIYPEVNFIEIDHPATNAEKSKALFDQSPKNLHLLAVDLSQADTRKTMEEFPAFYADRETIYICEGVLMYLAELDVIDLFDTLKVLTKKQAHFVFTCVEPMESPLNNTSLLLRLYLKLKNEPLNWLIAQNKISEFVKDRNYMIQDIAGTDELESRYLKNIKHGKLHRGEYLVSTIGN